MSDPISDNVARPLVPTCPPDPHGQAALLLVESLIHGLVVRSGLSAPEAIDIVESAIAVENDISDDLGADLTLDSPTAVLLKAIASSLRIDEQEIPRRY